MRLFYTYKLETGKCAVKIELSSRGTTQLIGEIERILEALQIDGAFGYGLKGEL